MARTHAAEHARLTKEVELLAPLPSWDESKDLKKYRATINDKTLNFEGLVDARQSLSAEIEFRKKKLEVVNEEIEAAMLVADQEKVECSGYAVTIVKRTGSTKITAEKLLANGVAADVIAASMEKGKDTQHITVRKIKD